MSVLRTSFTHVPRNHYSLLRIRVDYAPTFSPPITLLHLSKEPIPKLTSASSSSSSSVLPIIVEQDLKQEDRIIDEKEKNRRIRISLACKGRVAWNKGKKKEKDRIIDEKEKNRRIKIGQSNKGRVAWNKGKKHTAETLELIRIRTIEALSDPKVKMKKMSHTPHSHSEKTKAQMSYAHTLFWQERLKFQPKRGRKLIFLLWGQNIANAAMKGGSGQEELDWDSYDKIKKQLLLYQISEREKNVSRMGIIQSWIENIAKAAKEGGSGEQELDWDSYDKIREELFLLKQLRRSSEKAKAKEMAKIKAKKESQIKAIKRVRLTQNNRELRRRTKARKNKKSQPYKNTVQDKHALEVTPKFKLGSKLTKNHVSNNISSEVAEKGDIMYSNFPTHGKLDLELIREKMKKKVSLAEQIQAAKLMKGKLNS